MGEYIGFVSMFVEWVGVSGAAGIFALGLIVVVFASFMPAFGYEDEEYSEIVKVGVPEEALRPLDLIRDEGTPSP